MYVCFMQSAYGSMSMLFNSHYDRAYWFILHLLKMLSKSGSPRYDKLRLFTSRVQIVIVRSGDSVQNLDSPGLSGRVDSPVCCEKILGYKTHLEFRSHFETTSNFFEKKCCAL